MKLLKNVLFITVISLLFSLNVYAGTAIGISKATDGLTLRSAKDY